MNKPSSQKIIYLYYGFQIFFSLLVWLPIFYEYQKHFGLSDFEIFSIQSFYYLFFCILEIPTGLIADLWGYRLCMISGGVTLALAHVFPIWLPTPLGFLLHFVGIALARSLISGASSAYLYEHLKTENRSQEFRKAEGRARSLSLVARVISWSAVGWLMAWHLTLPYWLSLIAGLISIGFAVKLPTTRQNSVPTEKWQELLQTILTRLKMALQQLKASPYLVFLILQGVAIFVLGRVIQVNLFQPILSSKQIGLTTHGLIMAVMTLFEAVGSAYPHSLRKYLNDRNAVYTLTGVLGLCLIALPYVNSVGAIALLCLFALACGLAYPLQRHLFNDAIGESSYRATLLSIESIVDRAFSALVALFMGSALALENGLNHFILVVGALTLISIFLLVAGFRKFNPTL